MTMYDQDQLLQIHAAARKHKEHMWTHHGERDTVPVIALHFDYDGETRSVDVPHDDIQSALNNDITVGQIVAAIFGTMPQPLLNKLDELWMCVDAYTEVRGSLDDLPQRGDMREDFRTNPATNVSETLITIVASDDRCGGCNIQEVNQHYTVSDGGVMIWGTPESRDDGGGAVIEAIKAGFRKELS
jgi:hypothetical protein